MTHSKSSKKRKITEMDPKDSHDKHSNSSSLTTQGKHHSRPSKKKKKKGSGKDPELPPKIRNSSKRHSIDSHFKSNTVKDPNQSVSVSAIAQFDSRDGDPAHNIISSASPNGSGHGRLADIPINLRPITHVWVSEHLQTLTRCSAGKLWLNVRVLSSRSMLSATPEDVVKAFDFHRIHLLDVLALDLGWTKGEWMVRVNRGAQLDRLKEKGYYSGGVLMSHLESGGFDFIISRFPSPKNSEQEVNKFSVPVVLMGIPFYYNPTLPLDRYLYEAITAQNRHLGIRGIAVQQVYTVGSVRTNDVRCHLMLDGKALHKWDFDRPMKLTVQGWDNQGTPTSALWPVNMRHLDECLVCGDYYHHSEQKPDVLLTACKMSAKLDELEKLGSQRRKFVQNNPPQESVNGLMDISQTISRTIERVEGIANAEKTSIGFVVATFVEKFSGAEVSSYYPAVCFLDIVAWSS
ncbi:hypothetical protein O181_033460 [Austropuccinia psidii MF-1]|uniref:Uncharacterized protein n=1 Tax=Austropuccinia psidii MF-1 TaxID=1389203 RepID=A0A9Q3D340_9BASI|nr:hypothetical protein [Austropuccinia psidii MF-1]